MSDSDELLVLDRQFTQLMVAGCARLERDIGYRPTRFRQMVADHGGVGAARALLAGPSSSDGFTTLWETGRLALSVEAHVVLPRFASVFTPDEIAKARRRLEDHGFDVDRFLDALGGELP